MALVGAEKFYKIYITLGAEWGQPFKTNLSGIGLRASYKCCSIKSVYGIHSLGAVHKVHHAMMLHGVDEGLGK